MTLVGIKDTLYASSNQNTVSNVIPNPGERTRSIWYPSVYDSAPELRITLPEVRGLTPDEYDLMSIEIVAVYLREVTVSVIDSNNDVVYSVSLLSLFLIV